MSDTPRDPIPAIVLGVALVIAGIAGVMLADALITGRALRDAARKLRENPPPPAHTDN